MHDARNKAASIWNEEFRSTKVEIETNSLAFVTTFNPNNINLLPHRSIIF